MWLSLWMFCKWVPSEEKISENMRSHKLVMTPYHAERLKKTTTTINTFTQCRERLEKNIFSQTRGFYSASTPLTAVWNANGCRISVDEKRARCLNVGVKSLSTTQRDASVNTALRTYLPFPPQKKWRRRRKKNDIAERLSLAGKIGHACHPYFSSTAAACLH